MSKPAWQDVDVIDRWLLQRGWQSPDTYGQAFAEHGDFPAIYLFSIINRENYGQAVVGYVGMSVHLSLRWDKHNVLPELRRLPYFIKRWFLRMPASDLRSAEKEAIAHFSPPWNIVGKRRGMVLQ